ncbi:MAG: hypothetical protein ACTH8B_11625 [Serratia proteamaculans]
MNKALPDAMVTGFEPLISGITLPDPDNRHVVAAAVRSKAEIIVTANLKDFPQYALDKCDIEALHPDGFITDLCALNMSLVLNAVKKQRTSMGNPPKSVDNYLDALQHLPQTAKELNEYYLLLL